MSTPPRHPEQDSTSRPLSTPRAAALAGVLFAVLFGTTLILIRIELPYQDSTRLMKGQQTALTTATVLMPIAGIGFLWFIGVVRDGFGRYEDRFFVSVFLGSGLLFLAMMFVATAAVAALLASNTAAVDPTAHREVINFAKVLVFSATQTYALRMAAVFMISLATIWLKTRLMPRWLAALSYLSALTLLGGSNLSMWVTLVFPTWALVVSGLILVRSQFADQPPDNG